MNGGEDEEGQRIVENETNVVGRREALSGERVAERKQEGELRSENGAREKRGRKRQKIKRAALDKLVRDALEMKHDDET